MLIAAINGIVANEVSQIVRCCQVICRDKLELRRLKNDLQGRSADSSKSVDCYSCRSLSLRLRIVYAALLGAFSEASSSSGKLTIRPQVLFVPQSPERRASSCTIWL